MKNLDRAELSIQEVVNNMRITEQFEGPLREAIARKLTAESAKKSGIEISLPELQKAVDEFRAARGLRKKQATEDWLKSRGLSLEDLESYLETDLLIDKFKSLLDTGFRKGLESAPPEASLAVREVTYRKWLAEQFRQVKLQPT